MQINEEELVNQIKGFVSENLELSSMSDEQLEEKIDQIVSDRLKDTYCPIEKKISIAGQVYSSIRGFGLLDSIISDDTNNRGYDKRTGQHIHREKRKTIKA